MVELHKLFRSLIPAFSLLLALACAPVHAAEKDASEPLRSKLEAEAALFVLDKFLNEANRLPDVTGFYGESVFYFDQGVQTREEVLADKRAYFDRWPSRKFGPDLSTLQTRVIESPDGRKDVEVRLEVDFEVEGREQSASGRSVVVVVVAKREGGFMILSEGGRVISRR